MPQSLLVRGADSHHSPHVLRLWKSDRDRIGPSGHAYCFPYVCEKTNPAEEVCKDVEHRLQPLHYGQFKQPFIRVEEIHKLLDSLNKYLCLRLQCQHHHHPVMDHGVHNHIEDCAVQSAALVYPTAYLEGGGGAMYLPYFPNIHNQVQYVCKTRSVWGPMTYPAKILRNQYQSRASYAFCTSSKMMLRTASWMTVS